MSRKSGNRFSEKDMRQQMNREHIPIPFNRVCSRARLCETPAQRAFPMSDAANNAPPAPTVDPTALKEIAPGVHVITDRRVPLVPNIGIIVGNDAVLVVDTGMGPANGQKVLECAKKLAGGKPLILTLTHFHPEHGFGAQVFKGAARIHYNIAQRDELAAKGEGYLGMFKTFGPGVAEALEGTKLVEPDDVYK